MLLLISIISLVVLPLLINKTTEHHLDWIKPYLRQAWCGVVLVYVIYFLTTDTAKSLFASWRSGFGTAHPELAYVIPMIVGGVIVPAYWWFMGKLLPNDSSSLAAKSKGPTSAKLLIRSAFYGTGPFDDKEVTEILLATARDALVVPVDNKFLGCDPAPNKRKRLCVEYSYGNLSSFKIARPEGSRLVLPEDSEVQRLTGEVEQLTYQLAAAKIPTPPTIQQKTNNVDITGEILHARRPMRIGLGKGQVVSMLLLKLRVSTTSDFLITIRRANLTVESDGKKYEGKKQPIEIEPVTFHYQFGKSREERPFDLIERIEKAPLRRFIGTEGWLQFLLDDLPDTVGLADLKVTLTDELGGQHDILAKSFSID